MRRRRAETAAGVRQIEGMPQVGAGVIVHHERAEVGGSGRGIHDGEAQRVEEYAVVRRASGPDARWVAASGEQNAPGTVGVRVEGELMLGV